MVNSLAAFGYGSQLARQDRDNFADSRLNQLASMGYGASPQQQQGLLKQAASLDRTTAANMQQQFQGDEDRQMNQLVGRARYMKTALDSENPAAIAGAWRTVRPGLIRAGLATEEELSPDWQPDYAQSVHQILAMGGGLGGAGSTIQSQKVSDDGYIVNTYRDGRMEKTNQKVDRQMWFRDHPGMDPQLVGKDGSVQAVGQSSTTGLTPDGFSVAGQGAGQVRVNLDGMDPQRQNRVAQTVSMMQQAGYPEEDIEQFIQGQMSQQVTNIGAPRGAAPRQSLARPSPAQEAASTERAKLQAQLEYLPREQEIRTQADVNRAAAIDSVKREAERQAGAPKAKLALDMATSRLGRVDALVESILPRINSATAGWLGGHLSEVNGTAAADLRRDIGTLQAIAGFDELNAMKASSPTGGALGNVTERELAFLQSVVRNIENSQSPAQLRRNLLDFQKESKASWERVNAAYEQDYGQKMPTRGAGTSGAAPVQRARNPQTGQVVELRNGQWVPAQ